MNSTANLPPMDADKSKNDNHLLNGDELT